MLMWKEAGFKVQGCGLGIWHCYSQLHELEKLNLVSLFLFSPSSVMWTNNTSYPKSLRGSHEITHLFTNEQCLKAILRDLKMRCHYYNFSNGKLYSRLQTSECSFWNPTCPWVWDSYRLQELRPCFPHVSRQKPDPGQVIFKEQPTWDDNLGAWSTLFTFNTTWETESKRPSA